MKTNVNLTESTSKALLVIMKLWLHKMSALLELMAFSIAFMFSCTKASRKELVFSFNSPEGSKGVFPVLEKRNSS